MLELQWSDGAPYRGALAWEEEDLTAINLAGLLGEALNLTAERIARLLALVLTHRLTTNALPESVRLKSGSLSPGEQHLVREHVRKGFETLHALPDVATLFLYHHENWDGSGYPIGLCGQDIPLESRIMSIISAYCAMIFPRPHRRAQTVEEAINELRRCSGTQFQPILVDIFVRLAGVAPKGPTAYHD